LAQLAAKFPVHDEVLATEALGLVLNHSPAARHSLATLLKTASGTEPTLARIASQFVAGDESRPDLAVYGPKDALVAFLEAKFWAGLTDAQPVDYLRRLEEQKGGALLFVVPANRMDSVSRELQQRLVAAKLDIGSWGGSSDLKVAKRASGATVILTSWASLLRSMGEECTRQGEGAARADVDQLVALAAKFEAEGFAPMSAEALSDISAPRRMMALYDTCEAAVQRAASLEVVHIGRLHLTHGKYSSGRYVAFPEAGVWIGLDLDAWARFQASPLWARFDTTEFGLAPRVREALQGWEGATPRQLFAGTKGDAMVPLFVPPGAERDEVIRNVVEQIRAIGQELKRAGLPIRAPSSLAKAGPAPESVE